jgi:lipid-A-disaccharide synthase
MSAAAPRIWISAGEPSGDLHGARVVEALRERWPAASITACGGPKMAAAGATVSARMEELSAFGLVEILAKVPVHLRLLRRLKREFSSGAYDLVILIDYPGFHLRVAEAARRAGIPVLYYIAPQLWAWAPGRARRFAGAVDRMAVILPFEPAFFGRVGIRADYVGHPLVDRAPWPSRTAARSALGLSAGDKLLGIFPGSRQQEIQRIWPLFRSVALRMLEEGRCRRAVVAGTTDGQYPDPGPITIHRDDPIVVFAASDAALAKSGTTTLECALAGAPMVVAYLTNPLTYQVGSRLMTVDSISLVNLVAGRKVVPEFWRRPVRAEEVAEALRPLLDPASAEYQAQRAGLAQVVERLGAPGAAGRVAAIAGELLGR